VQEQHLENPARKYIAKILFALSKGARGAEALELKPSQQMAKIDKTKKN
jgi:hypothetical protein